MHIKHPTAAAVGCPLYQDGQGLNDLDLCCLWTLGAILCLKFYLLTFLQSAKAICLNRREMYEYIFAAVSWSNKTKTF